MITMILPVRLSSRGHHRWLGFAALFALLALALLHAPKASAAACTAPATDYGTVSGLSVTAPASSTYRVWTRMAAPDTTNNTYLLEVDGSSCYTVGGGSVPVYASGATTYFNNDSSNWISKDTSGTQIDVSLSAGAHTLKLIGNAPNVVVDRVIITQDTTCVPTGTGDNCANPPDTTPPVVSIASPANNASLSATTTVTASATDDVAVAKVAFYVDGTLVATDTTAPYTYSLNPSGLSTGAHTLYAVAYDTSSNSAQSTTVNFTVPDTSPPTVSVSGPASGATVSGTIALTANASDNVGVTKVDFFVDGGATAVGSDAASPYSISYNTSSLSNGSHTVVAKAYDAAGNSTASSSVSFTVNNLVTPPPDTTPPVITITSPVTGVTVSGSSVTIAATATDTSGIKQVQFYVDGVLKSTDTAAPYSYTLNSTLLSNASHTLTAVATDSSPNQNSATSAVVTVTVNNITYKSADINMDGVVDIRDFGLLKASFGQSGVSLGRVDVNGDGVVDIRDFGVLKTQFGT